MTDNDIIKALECCFEKDLCEECPLAEHPDCLRIKERKTIALVRQQQKSLLAYIDKVFRLTDMLKQYKSCSDCVHLVSCEPSTTGICCEYEEEPKKGGKP